MPRPPSPLLAAAAALAALACVRSPEPDPSSAPATRPGGAARADAARGAATKGARIIVRSRKCMGTKCDLTAFHDDEALVDQAFARGFDELDRVEALMSSWRDASDVARINDAAGAAPAPVAPDTLAVIKQALWIAERSRGAFDVTVGVYRGLWKFDEDKDGTLPDTREVARRRRLVGWRDVLVDEKGGTVKLRRKGQRLNLEGLAKGYAVDAAVRAVRAAGLRDFLIQAGGDLFASGRRGSRDWIVGIQDPRGPRGKIIFSLSLSDRAFNTSGDYERSLIKDGVRYHHILDARTGLPARKCRSVTILAKDAFTADTVDTAVFVMGPDEGMRLVESLPDVEAVMVDADNRVHVSSGLKDRLVKRGDPTPGI